jgi:hypothetical protein
MARTRSQSREPSVEPQSVRRQVKMVDGVMAGGTRQAQQRKSTDIEPRNHYYSLQRL